MKLSEIVHAVRGELDGDGDLEIRGVSGIREAAEGELTFLAHPRYADALGSTQASAILLPRNGFSPPPDKAIVYCENPYASFLRAVKLFVPDEAHPPGVADTAVIGENVSLGQGVSIGERVVIESDVRLGDGVVVRPGVFIGRDVRIGDNTLIHPNVSIQERVTIGARVIVHCGTVIGSDGFGFVKDGDTQVKVPQLGTVEIGDDVEIGANCAIDRGASRATRIGNGSKLDNLVHIGHNVTVGENTLVIAQVGIGGSTDIGSRVTLAGQVGVVGHISIGDDAAIGAQSGVTKSVPARARWSGYPARPHGKNLRAQGLSTRVARMAERIEELTARLTEIEERK